MGVEHSLHQRRESVLGAWYRLCKNSKTMDPLPRTCDISISKNPVEKALKPIWIQEPNLELHSRATSSVEAHHHVNGPDTGRNSAGRRIKNK